MGQEFVIKSTLLEDKINQLLPSQGGAQAGVDLSASTTIIPIVDLTESAEGSTLRQDLQTSLSFTSITPFSINNATTLLISTTGYYRVFGNFNAKSSSSAGQQGVFTLSDGVSNKNVIEYTALTSSTDNNVIQTFDFIVYLKAGDSFIGQSTSTLVNLSGATRQIADINGNLVNPL
jgi:hypothetical protein